MMSVPSTAISVSHLDWEIAQQAILSDVSFQLPRGAMLGVIGPNGAGKSSLLRCLYRYIIPTRGDVTLLEQPLHLYSAQGLALKVAVVQQDTPANIELTAIELVAMGLTPHKGLLSRQTAADNHILEDALIKVGLIDKAHQRFNALSGGEKQRVLIARAIVQQPQILVLDEPTNHLDIRYQIQILELVKTLGITVVASIHDLNLASAMCDQLILLNQGRLVAQGTPSQVLTVKQISHVFGVCCEISQHPQHGNPLITYYYGYHEKKGGNGAQTANVASLQPPANSLEQALTKAQDSVQAAGYHQQVQGDSSQRGGRS
ncbi:ABC transporter ATP-binding protein [Shewanella intestini]|uniref:ABC transporter ATP-binding protein n=1 Tax=Shewanella intestini TaxID=2017544 RepID=A0ABS5I390_9GAMM|nr:MULTISPECIES: ABC transporter ATP-binding protein [Shewanella]MBR9728490.1 ABC transporter ATP-binding protein [Shewanella intestini]MRG36309.1 ATP-binding cassette domain-containing protein [Shewanella sp. XMDDZSB0408]